jgi:hypothetical protein
VSVPVVVVRVAAVALGTRSRQRISELERILADRVELVETTNAQELQRVLAERPALAVVIDAAPPGQLTAIVSAGGKVPVLRPIWVERRNRRGETDRVFGGYGRLVHGELRALADAELARK